MKLLRYGLLFSLLFAALPAYAATLTFSAGAGYKPGDTIPVTVIVSSGTAINAVGATVQYPSGMLELLSISKAASVINFWAQEPASLGAGSIGMQGVVFDPGYTGSAGRVVQLVFRAKAVGAATLSFSDAQVLANDGMGTNVLTSAPSLSIPITAPVVPEKPAVKPGAKPAATTTATTTEATTTPKAETPAPIVQAPAQEPWYKQLLEDIKGNPLLYALLLAMALLIFFLGWLVGARAAGGHSRRWHSKLGVHREFNALKGAILEELQSLEQVRTKRELTAQEERLFKKLSRLIERSEERIEHELEKMVKE